MNAKPKSLTRSVVTGGCGFVGAPLVRQLLQRGEEVLVLDSFGVGGPERLPDHPRLVVRQVDIRDTGAVGDLMNRFGPSVVYHLAAIHFIPYCNEHPEEALEVNVRGTQSVIDAVSGAGERGMVFVSSAAVYPPSLQPLSIIFPSLLPWSRLSVDWQIPWVCIIWDPWPGPWL